MITAVAVHTQREHAQLLVSGKQPTTSLITGREGGSAQPVCPMHWPSIPAASRQHGRGCVLARLQPRLGLREVWPQRCVGIQGTPLTRRAPGVSACDTTGPKRALTESD